MKKVIIEMENGEVMTGELYEDIAPITVENFEKLANDGFYDGLTFHRVIPGFIEVVNRAYQVSMEDFNDAQAILNWNKHSNAFVSGSETKIRMNEYKTHINWAQQTIFMAEIFGIKN